MVEEMNKPYSSFFDFYDDEEEYICREHAEFFICPTCDELISFPGYSVDKKDLLLKDYTSYLMGVSDNICKYLGVTHEELILHSRIGSNSDFPVSTYHWSEP
ncbi:MAG TPA: hypothetical protein DDZ89_07935, partial [Clostridiales bacterium]|nr:hypothetical protein [Clostridiales bacterium]